MLLAEPGVEILGDLGGVDGEGAVDFGRHVHDGDCVRQAETDGFDFLEKEGGLIRRGVFDGYQFALFHRLDRHLPLVAEGRIWLDEDEQVIVAVTAELDIQFTAQSVLGQVVRFANVGVEAALLGRLADHPVPFVEREADFLARGRVVPAHLIEEPFEVGGPKIVGK